MAARGVHTSGSAPPVQASDSIFVGPAQLADNQPLKNVISNVPAHILRLPLIAKGRYSQ
jgi:hypothetical protein